MIWRNERRVTGVSIDDSFREVCLGTKGECRAVAEWCFGFEDKVFIFVF